MSDARQHFERARAEQPVDLRAFVWTLAPFGKRVLVAAASAVMTPAIGTWRATLLEDPTFAGYVGDDSILVDARDAVLGWLEAPDDATTAQLHVVAPVLKGFHDRIRHLATEISGDGNLHFRAASLARCIHQTVCAAAWSEADARRHAAGDAAEEAARIASGPAYEAGEAVALFDEMRPDNRSTTLEWITQSCMRIA